MNGVCAFTVFVTGAPARSVTVTSVGAAVRFVRVYFAVTTPDLPTSSCAVIGWPSNVKVASRATGAVKSPGARDTVRDVPKPFSTSTSSWEKPSSTAGLPALSRYRASSPSSGTGTVSEASSSAGPCTVSWLTDQRKSASWEFGWASALTRIWSDWPRAKVLSVGAGRGCVGTGSALIGTGSLTGTGVSSARAAAGTARTAKAVTAAAERPRIERRFIGRPPRR